MEINVIRTTCNFDGKIGYKHVVMYEDTVLWTGIVYDANELEHARTDAISAAFNIAKGYNWAKGSSPDSFFPCRVEYSRA